MNLLTEIEVAALRGERTREEWQEVTGPGLFTKGLTGFDPLTGQYMLTQAGRKAALEVREQRPATASQVTIPTDVYWHSKNQQFYNRLGDPMGKHFYHVWFALAEAFPLWSSTSTEEPQGLEVVPIPLDVFFYVERRTFYNRVGKKMDYEFHTKWLDRASEFARWNSDVQPEDMWT